MHDSVIPQKTRNLLMGMSNTGFTPEVINTNKVQMPFYGYVGHERRNGPVYMLDAQYISDRKIWTTVARCKITVVGYGYPPTPIAPIRINAGDILVMFVAWK